MTCVSGIVNGWLMLRHKALNNRLNAQDERQHALEKQQIRLDGALKLEEAKRANTTADITRIDEGVQEINKKLEKMLQDIARLGAREPKH